MSPAAAPLVAQLAAVPLLSACDHGVLARLAPGLRVVDHAKGAILLSQGDSTRDLLLLLAGELIANRYSADGQEVGYRRLVAPAHFGELAALDSGPRSLNIMAATDARVASISPAVLAALLAAQPALAQRLLTDLAGRVRELSDRLFEAGAVDTRGRVAATIVRLAMGAQTTSDGAEVFPSPTHAELAAMVGGTRESVTRAIGQLADAGVLSRHGRHIIIHEFDALMALSGG